jgi:hypothetical protein
MGQCQSCTLQIVLYCLGDLSNLLLDSLWSGETVRAAAHEQII